MPVAPPNRTTRPYHADTPPPIHDSPYRQVVKYSIQPGVPIIRISDSLAVTVGGEDEGLHHPGDESDRR